MSQPAIPISRQILPPTSDAAKHTLAETPVIGMNTPVIEVVPAPAAAGMTWGPNR